mmetsp:Transcript_4724/g.11116  ORF Transcript_4724/g.11116 Transcript_4724/m.11116 type:complete len:136 (+) Transcript_4724:1071-1478(+)
MNLISSSDNIPLFFISSGVSKRTAATTPRTRKFAKPVVQNNGVQQLHMLARYGPPNSAMMVPKDSPDEMIDSALDRSNHGIHPDNRYICEGYDAPWQTPMRALMKATGHISEFIGMRQVHRPVPKKESIRIRFPP